MFKEALRRLAPLSERDKVRWQDLTWFLLSWAVRRRPGGERHELFAAVLSHVENAAVQEEIRAMSQQVEQTWEQEVFARGETRGALRAARDVLRDVLGERFGELPEALVQRIEVADDLAHLRAAVRQALHIQSAEELQL